MTTAYLWRCNDSRFRPGDATIWTQRQGTRNILWKAWLRGRPAILTGRSDGGHGSKGVSSSEIALQVREN